MAHIRRAITLDVVAMSLVLVAAATYGALNHAEPTFWRMGRAVVGLWV